MSLHETAGATRHAATELIGEAADRLGQLTGGGDDRHRRTMWPMAVIVALAALALIRWRRSLASRSKAHTRSAPTRPSGSAWPNRVESVEVPGAPTDPPVSEPAEDPLLAPS